jgi:hypothetical protein
MLHLRSTLPLVLALASVACGCARDPASPAYDPLTTERRHVRAVTLPSKSATPCQSADQRPSGDGLVDVRLYAHNMTLMADAIVGKPGVVLDDRSSPPPLSLDRGIEIVLRNIRQIRYPPLSRSIEYLPDTRDALLRDSRSRLAQIWRVDEATVWAADLAYDVDDIVADDLTSKIHLDPAKKPAALANYEVIKVYADTFSGFKAIALEIRPAAGGDAHRIYAAAGTQVFISVDLRDWASGMLMARPHFVSDAALSMIKDAAAYASDTQAGGEVFITGQSQGALTAQGLGFLLQEYLNARGTPHNLVHVVSWGATGATEEIIRMIESERARRGRGLPVDLKRHWSGDAGHQQSALVWDAIAGPWAQIAGVDVPEHVRAVAAQLRSVGFFFDIDPFAHAGTFLGTPMVFPTELVLPDRCDELVSETLFNTRIGLWGIKLESHFLKGYRRAVERGAVALAWPARPERWDWVTALLPFGEAVGRSWLRILYLHQLGASHSNWQRCTAAGTWVTDRNRDCRKTYWPGCSPAAGLIASAHPAAGETLSRPDEPAWCLVPGTSHASKTTAEKELSDFSGW